MNNGKDSLSPSLSLTHTHTHMHARTQIVNSDKKRGGQDVLQQDL